MIYAMLLIFCIGIKPLNALSYHQTIEKQKPYYKMRPLFKSYPSLQKKIPHQQIANLPTPIIRLTNIGKVLKLENLYIKQDVSELIGRKLEFFLADAKNLHAQAILTTDKSIAQYIKGKNGAQTLNKRIFACLLAESPYQAPKQQDALCDERLYKTKAQQAIGIARIGAEETEAVGISPYYIPEKGNNKIGNIGVINAAFELQEQIARGTMPKPDLIYIGADTFGTAASLYLGCKLAGIQTWIMIIQENKQQQGNQRIKEYFEDTNKHLHEQAPKQVPLLDYAIQKGYFIRQDLVENNAATMSKVNEATQKLAQYENIQLHDAPSAKAFTALIQDASTKMLQHLSGKKQPVILFWNTDSTSL